jgi:hypothetical protein
MTPRQQEQLLREIARVTEAAFRRGFQHGHNTAARGDELAVDIEKWRFAVPLHRSPSPHGGLALTAEERLRIQHPEIDRVIRRISGT